MRNHLVRRPLPAHVDPWDRHVVRAWLMDVVHKEVVLTGGPLARLIRVAEDSFDSLDLDQLSRTDPGFDPGSTIQDLARGACQVFVVARLAGPELPQSALLFHAESAPCTAWWMATLRLARDPTGRASVPTEKWSTTVETTDPSELPSVLREWTARPRDRPALVRPAPALTEVRATFGYLPAAARIPTDARTLTHLAVALTLDDLLTGSVCGAMIVRVRGRHWESWVIGDDLNISLDEAIRAIACNGMRADAIALIQLSMFDDFKPPIPGLKCVAQHGDERLESWTLLSFPLEPGGPLGLTDSERWRRLPQADNGGWLRPPNRPVDLIALGAAEA